MDEPESGRTQALDVVAPRARYLARPREPSPGWMQFGSEAIPNLFERFVMNNSTFGIQGILEASLSSGLKSLFASSAYDYAGNVVHDAMAASALKGGN
jgi:hypothetical protein